jgi:hypothetical protein
LAIAVATFYYNSIGAGYVTNPEAKYMSLFGAITGVCVPLALWIIANWCLTTLFDGEGSFTDVYITTCYALVPVVLLVLPTVMVSNFVTISEQGILTMIETIAWGWAAFLLFFGMMVIHDYGLFKNFIITIATIVFMMFVMFVAVLFTSLLGRVFTFFYNIYAELSYRWS